MAASTFGIAPEMPRDERLTLLDFIAAVQDAAESDAEVVATLGHMLESDRVRFDGFSIAPLTWVA
jgi:hypothetical protein